MFTVLLPPASRSSASAFEETPVRLIHWPPLEPCQPSSFRALDEAIDNLFGYDWVLFRNKNAAEYFLARFEKDHTVDELDNVRVLAIGDGSGERLARSHIHVDVALERASVGSLISALEAYAGDISGLNILAPSAGLLADGFEEQLRNRGARVDNVVAYRTVPDKARLVELQTLLIGGGIDWIGFANPAHLAEFAQVFDSCDLPGMLTDISVACGGDDTANAAIRFGLAPLVTVPQHDIEAVLKSIALR